MIAGVVVLIGGLPLVAAVPWATPIMLLPLAIVLWVWRAGTDAGPEGLRVRALFGERRLTWDEISALVPSNQGRITATLTDGTEVPLTAVTAADLPRLVAAGGSTITRRTRQRRTAAAERNR